MTAALPAPTHPAAEAPDATLAAVFARHAERWALQRGATPALARAVYRAAELLSLATSNGQVCLLLDELPRGEGLPADSAAWRAALEASGITGSAAAPGSRPLTLDEDGRLYLQRFFDLERRLAARLWQAASAPPQPLDAAARQRLDARFGPARDASAVPAPAPTPTPASAKGARRRRPHHEDSGQIDWLAELDPPAPAPAQDIDWQKAAAALALRQRLVVLSGGPGTGKTTAVVNLLACLVEQQPGCRIALAAPTGKAAARMAEALRERAQHLPPALRDRLPTEAFTVHRLLGTAPGLPLPALAAPSLLPIDLLIVDEASMLDLALATRLVEALPADARLVLLGDKDQLAAVESGAVFAELSADRRLSDAAAQDIAAVCGVPPAAVTAATAGVGSAPPALPDSVVWLQRNFRFAAGTGIGRLAAEISAGRAGDALATLRDPAQAPSLRWLDDGGATPGAATLQAIAAGYAGYFDAVRRDPSDAAAVAAAFSRYRVLCALRSGPRGVEAVNEHAGRLAQAALDTAPAGAAPPAWYTGRPVMVLRNDYLLKLFNGDIGIALPSGPDGALAVHFPDAAGGWRAIAPARLPPHQTAYAMTVHKSQGSEFDGVLVLLPEHRSRVLTRELLYTGVTRARARVAVSASPEVLAATIAAATHRHSGLVARLRELRAAGPAPRAGA